MSRCPETDQILAALVAEDGNAEEIRAHISSCERCSALVDKIGGIVSVMGGSSRADMPEAWVDRVVERVSPDRGQGRVWWWVDLIRSTAPTFALAALTAIALLVMPNSPSRPGLDLKSMVLSAFLVGLVALVVDIRHLMRRGHAADSTAAGPQPPPPSPRI